SLTLRDEGRVGDEDHGALLDRRRDPVRGRFRALLPRLHFLPPLKLPRRALVVGLARSGEAAALALTRRGVEVLGADRDPGIDAGRLAEAGVEVHVGTEEDRLLE